MNAIDPDQLTELVVEALERTALVLADPVDPNAPGDLPAPARYSLLKYSGDANGHVCLAASDGFVRELAASLLGEEPEDIDPAGMGQEALNEFANIVGGSVVLALGGDTLPIKLHLPQPSTTESPEDPSAVICLFDAEGQTLRVSWHPESQAA